MITTETETVKTTNELPDSLGDKAITKRYLDFGIKTNTGVEIFTKSLREPKISTKVNCRNEDHCAPFEFLSDVLLDRVRYFILWANRSGSKSYFAGLISWAKSSMNKMDETCILGGSESQSEKAYKAMNDFWRITGLIMECFYKPR